jgi:hypothetical protein
MQDSRTFLQKGLVSQKGSDFLTFVCPSHEGIRKFSFRRLAVGEKLFFKQETHARARRKREREERNKKRVEVVEARVLRLYSIIDPKRNGRRRRRRRRKREK